MKEMKAKLCGMKTLEAAQAAVEAGADFVGFIFCPQSKRNISPGAAAKICSEIGFRARKVGVFVDEELYRVNVIAELCHLDYVQLHGHEDADYIRQIRRPVIKAVPYGPDFSAREINRLPAELILVDTYLPGMAGGTGETFDWRSAAKEIKKIKQSVLIAGGINVDNVKEAWDTFHPYGVDVSGGLETDGEKDIQKIQAFMQRVKVINRRKEMPKGLVVDEEHTGGDCPEEEGNCSGCQASNALG